MNKKSVLFICSLVLAFSYTIDIKAQFSSGGNMLVAENGSVFMVGVHNFEKGSGLFTSGVIKTSRTNAKGYVNFTKSSSWTGAGEGRFIDGYVRVTHDQAFVFPIGDNKKFRPVASSGAKNTTAAYYNESPTKGLSNKDTKLSRISDREYWDIGGDTPSRITLQWGQESNVANMSRGQLEQLTLVGWRNSQWEIIPSTLERHALEDGLGALVAKSDFSDGIISTTNEIVPDEYKYITLGVLKGEQTLPVAFATDVVSVFPNPVAEDIYVDLKKLGVDKGSIKIYDLDGKEMSSRKLDNSSESVQHFDASNYTNGIYKVYIKVKNRTATQKFMVGRLY